MFIKKTRRVLGKFFHTNHKIMPTCTAVMTEEGVMNICAVYFLLPKRRRSTADKIKKWYNATRLVA